MIFDHTNLPSRTIPYPVKQIEVKELRPKQIALLSKSVMLDDLGPAIEALGEAMTNLDVMDLTTGDFFYLLTWQRFNALKRNKVMAQWTCPGALFIDNENNRYTSKDVLVLVDNWEAADEEARQSLRDPNDITLSGYVCNHANYVPVEFSEFSIAYLPEDTVLDSRLDYPRCLTLAEYSSLQRDPDLGMLADAAQWLKGHSRLRERISDLVDAEDTELLEIACEASRDVQHGIMKSVTKKCEECGHEHTMSFVVDPKSFFL